MVVLISSILSGAQNLLQASFNQVTQLWILAGLTAMFVIGLVIYVCYSKSLGIPEGEEK